MPDAEKKLLKIYNILAQEVYNSSWYFSIVQELSRKFNNDEIIKGERLLGYSYFGCLRETLLCLCRIYFQDKDSITLQLLKNHLVYNRKKLDFIDEDSITVLEKEIDNVLEKQAPLLEKIKLLRDKNLAHLDKKQISDPNVIVPEDIDFYEIDNCIADFSKLMIKISDLDSRLNYPNVNPKQIIQQELENLLG